MPESGSLPPKLYFRIGEVAHVVGVEPHVLRYWEREFRSIRPTKSARGQRVYSRRDVESLLKVRDLLYGQGFTIAGARKRLRERDGGDGEAATSEAAAPATSPAPAIDHVAPPVAGLSPRVRGELLALKAEVEALLQELGGAP
jgi:DNA-binding transcriptional MerR regulator